MARGFIRNPLDVRLLILYILDHLILPVTMTGWTTSNLPPLWGR